MPLMCGTYGSSNNKCAFKVDKFLRLNPDILDALLNGKDEDELEVKSKEMTVQEKKLTNFG